MPRALAPERHSATERLLAPLVSADIPSACAYDIDRKTTGHFLAMNPWISRLVGCRPEYQRTRTLSIECGSRASIYTWGRCRQYEERGDGGWQQKQGVGDRVKGVGNWVRVVRRPDSGRHRCQRAADKRQQSSRSSKLFSLLLTSNGANTVHCSEGFALSPQWMARLSDRAIKADSVVQFSMRNTSFFISLLSKRMARAEISLFRQLSSNSFSFPQVKSANMSDQVPLQARLMIQTVVDKVS